MTNSHQTMKKTKAPSDWESFNGLLYKMAYEIWLDVKENDGVEDSEISLESLVHTECIAYIERESPKYQNLNMPLTHYFILSVLDIISDFNGVNREVGSNDTKRPKN